MLHYIVPSFEVKSNKLRKENEQMVTGRNKFAPDMVIFMQTPFFNFCLQKVENAVWRNIGFFVCFKKKKKNIRILIRNQFASILNPKP